ncbi:unnamed protein product [Ectocarpus sp. 12 AP-2014]
MLPLCLLALLPLLSAACALVSGFIGDDLSAARGGGLAFCLQPELPRHGRSEAVVGKDSSTVGSRRQEKTAITMLTTTRTFGAGSMWPSTPASGGIGSGSSRNDGASPGRRRPRARTGGSSSANSDSALHAMAIPARCALPSVDLLRQAYGPRRHFWGDLTPAETRRFYHELLPVSVYVDAVGAKALCDGNERPLGGGMSGGGLATVVDVANRQQGGHWEYFFGAAETLEERARLASMARHAARLYVRERCKLPSRVVAHLYDGLRHLKRHGSFRVTGETWPELWDKYERKIRSEDPSLEGEDLKTAICLRILEKSCSTSEMFNNLSGCSDLNSFLPDTLTETAPTQHQEAFAAESAAACAGALRLIPLMQPFRRVKMQGEGAVVVQKRAKRHTRRRKILAGRRRRIRSSSRPRTL